MTLAVFLLVMLVVLPLLYFGGEALRTRRKPPALRGDWWTRFEREFRAYASTCERSRNRSQRRRDEHRRMG